MENHDKVEGWNSETFELSNWRTNVDYRTHNSENVTYYAHDVYDAHDVHDAHDAHDI